MFVALVQLSVALVAPTKSPRGLLVVGGSGYLGREVCRKAVSNGWNVVSLSRRGDNPEPDSAELSKVTWKKGNADDAALLSELCASNDAYVHSCAMLFDSESGLANLNALTSGSGSKVADGATYATAIAGTALPLMTAAEAQGGGPLVFVSAIGAGDSLVGNTLDKVAPDFFLARYLAIAKHERGELPFTKACHFSP